MHCLSNKEKFKIYINNIGDDNRDDFKVKTPFGHIPTKVKARNVKCSRNRVKTLIGALAERTL